MSVIREPGNPVLHLFTSSLQQRTKQYYYDTTRLGRKRESCMQLTQRPTQNATLPRNMDSWAAAPMIQFSRWWELSLATIKKTARRHKFPSSFVSWSASSSSWSWWDFWDRVLFISSLSVSKPSETLTDWIYFSFSLSLSQNSMLSFSSCGSGFWWKYTTCFFVMLLLHRTRPDQTDMDR